MSLRNTLFVLADLSFQLGAIGVWEHEERIQVAVWLTDDDPQVRDPRLELEGKQEKDEERHIAESRFETTVELKRAADQPDWIEFVAFKKWYFTKSDPDPYPSTPHGHLHSADRSWPKLNPYTGRVFAAKHQEDVSLRLTKHQMRELWRTEAFRDFCRSHIVWYTETFRHHAFAVTHPMRFPRW